MGASDIQPQYILAYHRGPDVQFGINPFDLEVVRSYAATLNEHDHTGGRWVVHEIVLTSAAPDESDLTEGEIDAMWAQAEPVEVMLGRYPQPSSWEQAVAKVRARYPEDIFPYESTNRDARSGTFARMLCDEIVRLSTEIERSQTEPES